MSALKWNNILLTGGYGGSGLSVFFVFLFVCCTPRKPTGETQVQKTAGWELIAKDTIWIDYPYSLQLIDFSDRRQSFLGYDYLNKYIIELSVEGKINYVYKTLAAEDATGFGKQMWGLCYFNDSTFVILGTKGFYWYDFYGKMVNKLPHPSTDGLWYNSRKKIYRTLLQDTLNLVAILDDHTDFSPETREYYQHAYTFATINAVSGKYTYHLPFNSDLYGKEYYYINMERLLDVDEQKQLVYVTYELDQHVYLYDLKSKKQVKETGIQPDFFRKPIGYRFGKKVSPDQILEAMAKNSVNHKIFVVEDIVVVEYYSGIDVENITLEQYNSTLHLQNKRYLAVIDSTGVDYRDIEVPPHCQSLNIVVNNKDLWFAFEDEEFPAEPEKQVFFVYNLKRRQGL